MAELEDMKQPLADLLWEYHNLKALPPVKCFTSSGVYVDHVQPGKRNKFPQSIEQFMQASGPYDVIIDGLNVGYFTSGFFDPRKVNNFAQFLVSLSVLFSSRFFFLALGPLLSHFTSNL